MMVDAENTATELKNELSGKLTGSETKTLPRLLQKVYL